LGARDTAMILTPPVGFGHVGSRPTITSGRGRPHGIGRHTGDTRNPG